MFGQQARDRLRAIEKEFLMSPAGASNRPYHNLQDLEAPFAAEVLAEAASRKARWHQGRADHWLAEATRLYQEGLPAALKGVQDLGKQNYTSSFAGGQMREDVQSAVSRLQYHRNRVDEYSNAAIAFTAHKPEYVLHIPIRIAVELDMAGYLLGTEHKEED